MEQSHLPSLLEDEEEMKKPRVHKIYSIIPTTTTYCGYDILPALLNTILYTESWTKVTCKNCLKMRERWKLFHLKAELVTATLKRKRKK